MKYAIWRGCERLGMRPPDIPPGAGYEDLEPWQQANVVSYNQIREIEEAQANQGR